MQPKPLNSPVRSNTETVKRCNRALEERGGKIIHVRLQPDAAAGLKRMMAAGLGVTDSVNKLLREAP